MLMSGSGPQRTPRRCLAGLQPIERGHRDHRPGGTSQVWRQACNLGVGSGGGHAVLSFPHSKTVPSTQMCESACKIDPLGWVMSE